MVREIKVSSTVIVEDHHFAYLRLQKGKLHDLSDNRALWHAAYEKDLRETYEEIAPFLPLDCWGLLDIGSGLGGIDLLISRHYAGQTFIHLLDGEDDPPVMRLHRETFNDMRVARDFLVKNGIRSDHFGYLTTRDQLVPKPYDLVVSFGSWCFHYEPNVYLPLLVGGGGLHEGSIVIVDLRRDKEDWRAQFWDAKFRNVAVVRESKKFQRVVWQKE